MGFVARSTTFEGQPYHDEHCRAIRF